MNQVKNAIVLVTCVRCLYQTKTNWTEPIQMVNLFIYKQYDITKMLRECFPANRSLSKFNSRNTIKWCQWCSKLTIKTPVQLVALLLTLNMFHTFFCFIVDFEHVNVSWFCFQNIERWNVRSIVQNIHMSKLYSSTWSKFRTSSWKSRWQVWAMFYGAKYSRVDQVKFVEDSL